MNPKAFKIIAIAASLLVLYLLVRNHHTTSSTNADDGNRNSDPASGAESAEQQRAEQVMIAKQTALARIESLESDYRTVSQELMSEKNNQADYNQQVQNYVMDHKAACLALGFTLAGGVVLVKQDKDTSDGEKFAAGVAAIGGAVWIYNNPDEAKEVGNALLQVQANQAEYQKQVDNLQNQINSIASELQAERLKTE